jgi:hypothetical protein
MPRLCFKHRPTSKTVQLVRHVYCPATKRSQTVSIGSLRWDADPDDFTPALSLRPGEVLCENDQLAIGGWLKAHGDKNALARRTQFVERIEMQVRQALQAQLATDTDLLAQAAAALESVTAALPALADTEKLAGNNARTALRPGYLKIHAAWGRLVQAAQTTGVAKIAHRKCRSAIDE